MDAQSRLLRQATPILLNRFRREVKLGLGVRATFSEFILNFSLRPITVPANCSTPFWDPIQGSCLCQESSCEFNDVSRPIGVCHFLYPRSLSEPPTQLVPFIHSPMERI